MADDDDDKDMYSQIVNGLNADDDDDENSSDYDQK